ncbi:putative E3 SUMO-protein ligase RNF212 [Gouania willdenowi]|uniref:RING-type domain-containing protein n=1 Tax=Gouania willdenowi TaxID=441366 RepID=A0A8C5HFH9_GOUWI|nr:probable E3 SUMO-protein ligase RNF212 [Gouania willdenowi]XP_028314976.1 probable E3 SUMO-protein ligase RNF212 [Gouania willdenowi]
MPRWICCNSCFLHPNADRKLAVTSCGHVICSVCYQRGKPGKCLICSAKCQVSALSNKSSPDVKALFSDINVIATKHLAEISKVLMFQTRHQSRLMAHYQQKNEKQEEVLVRMRQEMQQMTKTLNEQSAYIAKLENSLQQQRANVSSVPQMGQSSHTPHGHKPVHIPYNSAVSLSRHSSSSNLADNMEVDERSLFRKPTSNSRLSLINHPQDVQGGSIALRSPNLNMAARKSACSATVSRFQGSTLASDLSYSQSSTWKSPIFKPPSSFRHSSSLRACLPP